MAQIAAADVTYALVEGTAKNGADCRYNAVFDVTFGNGTLTYTNGGVPLTKGKLGCPTVIEELSIQNSGAGGFVYRFNHTASSIQMYEVASHVHNFIMAGGVTTTADFLYHSSGAIGKAAATNITVAGTAPATTGGVVGAAVAAMSEVLTSATVTAVTLRMRVVGW